MNRSDQAAEIVAGRAAGTVPDRLVSRALSETRKGFDTVTDAHAVAWNGAGWSDAPGWDTDARARLVQLQDTLAPHPSRGGWRLITRADVFDQADPLSLFLAAMAWGFGNRGYGWRRTQGVLAVGTDRVATAVSALPAAAAEGPAAVWRAWSPTGAARLHGLGPAFASKLAYFAAYDRQTGRGPLIVDMNTTWAWWALTGSWDSRYSPALYADYVDWAQQQATAGGCRSDDIERALFALGPPVRREHKVAQSG